MVKESSRLLALNEFCRQLDSIPATNLSAHTAGFLKEFLDVSEVRLTRAGDLEHLPDKDNWLHLPLKRSRLTLLLKRNRPFTQEEIAFAELIASLLSQSIHVELLSSRRWHRLALFEKLGQVIAEAPDLSAIFGVLEQEFGSAFPGTAARLLFKQEDGRLHVRVSCGVDGREAVPSRKKLDRIMAQNEPLLLDEKGQPVEARQARLVLLKQILIPIQVRNQPVGLLWVAAQPGTSLSERDVVYLDLLAGYIGIAVYTNRLIEEAWKRTNQMEMIYAVTESARSLQPLLPTLQEIHAQLDRAFNVPSFFVALYDPDTDLVTFPYAIDNQRLLSVEPVSVHHEESLTAWVIRNRQPYIATDWFEEEQPVPGIGHEGSSPRSILCFPLVAGDEVVGAFSVQSDRPHEFDHTSRHLLAVIADHLAVIVRNARLYSTTQQLVDTIAREYLTAASLRQAVAAVGTSLSFDVIVERLLLTLEDMVPYDVAAIGFFAADLLVFHTLRAGPDVEAAPAERRARQVLQDGWLVEQLVEQGEPICIADVQQDPRWAGVQEGQGVRSWLGIPLLASDQVTGVLVLEGEEAGLYGERETTLVLTLASHASLALQNARLHEEIQLQLAELTTLYEAGATITATLEQEEVLRTVVAEMVEVLNVSSCTIFVWESGRRQLRTAAHRTQVGTGEGQVAAGLSALSDLAMNPVVQRVFASHEILQLHQNSELDQEEKTLLEKAGKGALLLVPLVQRDQTLGLLTLARTEEARRFSERDMRLARNLAGQAAVAVEHAHLYTQAQRRIQELSTFHQIVLQVNMALDLEVVLENITESALRLIDASNLHIYLYDSDRDEFTFCSALWQDGRRTPAVSAPRANGLTARVVHQGEAIVIDDATQHALFQNGEAAEWGVKAIAGFPLKHAGRVIGAFTVTYLKPHIFSPDELLLMNLLADQAAVAVDKARLFSDAQSRLDSMSALVDLAKQVTGNLKVELVMQTTVQRLQKLLRARASTIALVSEDGTELIVEAGAGIKPEFHKVRMKLSEGVSGRALKEQQLIYVRDTQREPDFLFFDPVLRSLLVVPLVARNEVLGTLTVDSDRPDAFSESDIQLMTVAAAQVSVAIANAGLFEALEERAAELAVAYEELQDSDQLKDELVQNVSHELRTPLTFIRGYVDLLRDGEMGVLNSEQQSALQIVSEKTDEITRLVEDIMSLQRIDEKNLVRERFAMSDLLQASLDCHRMNASRQGLTIIYAAPADRGMVEADKGRITQVLDNLIGNAMKFSPNGGVIELRLGERDGKALISVTDEGIGVPADKVMRIFERFYQIDGTSRRRFGGAGLGLAIVKRIVDAHQGEIWVESQFNEGSTFYFTLPKLSAL